MSLHYLVKHEWPKNQRNVGFSVIRVSQGSVATYVRCGGMSTQCCIANFLLSLAVKEFLKSVKIWQSYCQSLGAWFFWNTVYIYILWSFASTFSSGQKFKKEQHRLFILTVSQTLGIGHLSLTPSALWHLNHRTFVTQSGQAPLIFFCTSAPVEATAYWVLTMYLCMCVLVYFITDNMIAVTLQRWRYRDNKIQYTLKFERP